MIKSGRRFRFVLLLVASLFFSGLSPAFAAWTTPIELGAVQESFALSGPSFALGSALAVQKDGVAHIVYLEKLGKIYSVVHLTNKTGSWQKETIISGLARLSSPVAAVRRGRLYLAWARGAGRGSEIVYADNATGAWSTGRMTDNSVADLNPAIAVRRGKVYIAWMQGERFTADGFLKTGAVLVKSNASGRWRTDKAGGAYFLPDTPQIKVDGAGVAHILYTGKTKITGPSLILHAENTGGNWHQEILPVNIDRSGKTVSAETPSIALYKNSVYAAFVRSSVDGDEGQIILAIKRAGGWRSKALTKKTATSMSLEPKIAVLAGHVKVAYSRITYALNGEFKSQARYLELVNGELRGEMIDSVSFTLDPFAPEPPPITMLVMTGIDAAEGLVHAAYLRVTLDLATFDMNAKIMYSRRDP